MKNAFLRIGYTCASLLVAGGFMIAVTPANAEMHDLAYVTLSQPVTVGTTTLPGGQYTISSEGDNVFLIHSDKGNNALIYGRPVDINDAAKKTEVILKGDNEGMRLDQLRFQGESTAYEFNQ
jgi:hypothetical protein